VSFRYQLFAELGLVMMCLALLYLVDCGWVVFFQGHFMMLALHGMEGEQLYSSDLVPEFLSRYSLACMVARCEDFFYGVKA